MIFKVRRGTGGTWDEYDEPHPEMAALSYAKDFDLNNREKVEVRGYGIYVITVEKDYFVKRIEHG